MQEVDPSVYWLNAAVIQPAEVVGVQFIETLNQNYVNTQERRPCV